MKKINYIALTFIALTSTALATVWSDDFESYPVGYDIADSADWTDEFCDGDHLIIDEIGGNRNKYIKDEMNEYIWWPVYGYTPPGIIDDSRISFDFLYTGENTYTSANFRLSDGFYRGYLISCFNDITSFFGTGDYVMIGTRHDGGMSYNSAHAYFLGDYFETDAWYHIDAILYGPHPPHHKITINDDLNFFGLINVGVPYGDEGYCGVSVTSSNTGTTYIDNFGVDDDPVITGIKSVSLGEIKASFR